MILTELMGNGALLSYLEANKDLPLEKLILCGAQVADGMTYLANKGFVHRDLAARNVLVAMDGTCKVADFGLSKEVDNDSDYFVASGGKIPIKWTAPEAIENHKYTSASDVWSYGILLWETMSYGARPYGEMNN